MLPYKLQIFVSSTIHNLPNERIAALKAIKEFGAKPIMSEFTINAQSQDSVATCLEKVKSSDIYILILGDKYGWQPHGKESITELEYKTAQINSIPTLVFNTEYEKDLKQNEFSQRVGATYFWKKIKDAFQLKEAILSSLKEEVDKWDTDQRKRTEILYTNLLKIKFPKKIYMADLDLNRDEIITNSYETKRWLKKDAPWFDVAISALYQRGLSFPHDWYIHNKKVITFHDLSEPNLPLAQICDKGTVTPLSCEEYYEQSNDQMNVFKSLLAKCLQTKLYKLNIRWYKSEKVFAFMPVTKNSLGHWVNRKVEWKRKKKISRRVIKINYGKKHPDKISSARHLAFEAKFHFLDNKWYISVKPDWFITFGDFIPSKYGFEKVQYVKQQEKNIHVFNHLNFILWYLQPSDTIELFEENQSYPFLTIEDFVKFESGPEIKDEIWRKLESKSKMKNLEDKSGNIDLFSYGN